MDWKRQPPSDDKNEEKRMRFATPSGLTHTWRLWRHCCCRYGWYPLLVAPIVTAGCLLSLLSSAGCDFLEVKIGFTPSNEAWNQSTAEMGLFFYQSGEPESNKYREALVDGCRYYSDEFTAAFIDEDRTWKVATIMAYISGISSLVATATAWLFVVSPLPAFFFWPGVLLPALMASFLAEGSKFLFFDTSICRASIWYPSGADSLPRIAEDCSLGATGHYAIAAGAVFFLCLILVCLKAPEKRKLDTEYGLELDPDVSDLDSPRQYGQSESSFVPAGSADIYDLEGGSQDRYSSTSQPPLSRIRTTPNNAHNVHLTPAGARKVSRVDPDYSYGDETGTEYSESYNKHSSTSASDDNKVEDDLISERLKNLDPEEDRYTAKPQEEFEDERGPNDRYQPSKPPATAGKSSGKSKNISESRLHTIERMKLNTTGESEDMIEKFVNELNVSFQAETKEKKKPELTVEPSLCEAICAPSTARSF